MQHPTHYNADESRRRAALLARGSLAVVRGKSTARTDAALEALAAEACERERAEAAAKEAVRVKAVREKAEAKAARKAESRWW